MYNLDFKTEVAQEIQEAYDWYELQQIGLGERLLFVLDDYFEIISSFPEQYPILHKSKRSVYIKIFPFQIIYSIMGNTVVVFSVFHTKRNPKIWKKRK